MNVDIFAPAGLLTGSLLSDFWTMKRRQLWMDGVFCLFSLGIEMTQYRLTMDKQRTTI